MRRNYPTTGIGTDTGTGISTGPGTGFDTGTFLVVGARTEEVGLEGGASHDSGVNATSRPHAVMFSLHYKLCSDLFRALCTRNIEAVKSATG